MATNNINLNDGLKEFTINNDPERTITFNPADNGILIRISEAYHNIEKKAEKIKDVPLKNDGTPDVDDVDLKLLQEYAKEAKAVDAFICEQMDYIFNAPVSDKIFQGTSPLSTLNGAFFFERFLTAVTPILEKEIEAERKASAKRIAKYTEPFKKKGGKK